MTTKSSSESPCAYCSVAGRALGIELTDEDLEVMERLRRQQELPPEDPEREGLGDRVAPQHSGT